MAQFHQKPDQAIVDDAVSNESTQPEAGQDSTAFEYGSAAAVRRKVSPTTHSEWRSTLRSLLKPVACWRVHHAYFRFDSSKILPDIAPEIARLKPLIQRDRVATVFGHADPVGSIDYNARLSARRARSLFALLTRNVDIWLDLFSDSQPYDAWGLTSTQIILAALQRLDGTGVYYTAALDGAFGTNTDTAIRDFQQDQELEVDGVAGPVTRRRMYELYMDALTGSPGHALMGPDQFLGDPDDNANPRGKAKAACQGCGEYNPIIILSTADEQRYAQQQDKTERNERNAPNRRVMVFFFSKKNLAGMDPAQVKDVWPCPAWNEGFGACATQAWPDREKRLANGDGERCYDQGEHTMACSWYDRFARLSPCERPSLGPDRAVWVRFDLTPSDAANRTDVLELAGASGFVASKVLGNSFFANETTVDVRFRGAPPGDSLTLTITPPDGSGSYVVFRNVVVHPSVPDVSANSTKASSAAPTHEEVAGELGPLESGGLPRSRA